MKQSEMKDFLTNKGINITKTEGDDFSSVFHISNENRAKIDENRAEYEKETGLMMMTSNDFGMSVVIMENEE